MAESLIVIRIPDCGRKLERVQTNMLQEPMALQAERTEKLLPMALV